MLRSAGRDARCVPGGGRFEEKEKGEIRTTGFRTEKDERIREAFQGEARDGRRHDPPAQGQGQTLFRVSGGTARARHAARIDRQRDFRQRRRRHRFQTDRSAVDTVHPYGRQGAGPQAGPRQRDRRGEPQYRPVAGEQQHRRDHQVVRHCGVESRQLRGRFQCDGPFSERQQGPDAVRPLRGKSLLWEGDPLGELPVRQVVPRGDPRFRGQRRDPQPPELHLHAQIRE